MSTYNELIASHYQAYRPPLHAVILRKCLAGQGRLEKGLDVGCGTGYSAMALLNYCKEVDAIDPSIHMINQALPHFGVSFFCSSLIEMGFQAESYDLITFAGSLHYIKSQKIVDELARISKKESKIIVYDFEIDLGIFSSILPYQKDLSDYDHEADFSNLLHQPFYKTISQSDQWTFTITDADLAHLLLSNPKSLKLASELFSPDIYEKVRCEISGISEKTDQRLDATLFYTVYERSQ